VRATAILLPLLILAGIPAGAYADRSASRPGPARAAWAYDLADRDAASLAAALDTLRAQGVTRIFLSIEDGPRFRLDTPAGRAGLSRAILAARARGLEVHAMLLQHPRWLDDFEGARRRVAAAAAFAEAPFDGIHLDVEPYTEDAWECGGPDGRTRRLERLAALAADARVVAAGPRPLPVSIALPWWALDTPAGDTLAGAADEVVLMGYGEPGGPLVGGDPAALACRLDLPGRLARLPSASRLSVGLASYEHADAAALQAAAGGLDALAGGHPRYGGTALFLEGRVPGRPAYAPDVPLVVSVRGRVVDVSGAPVQGAAVTLAADGAQAASTSNACGRFVARTARPGRATLSAAAPGGATGSRTLSRLVAGREREAGDLVVSGAEDRQPAEGGSAPVADPASPPYAGLLAEAARRAAAGAYEAAADAYAAALRQWPSLLEARLGLARIAAWQGRPEDAAARYRAILAGRCDAVEAILGLGDLARAAGRDAAAATHYAEVARRWPHEPAGHLGLARLALARGDTGSAARLLDTALALDPSDHDAVTLRARLARLAGPAEALQ
jgi:hypothetical protein